jgi:CRP/FNR family cyclic AMP-dependent transcriptional regulator
VATTGYERVLVLEALGRIGTFKGCDKRQLGLVADAVQGRSTVKSGEVLCREGDPADSWWVVLKGSGRVDVGGTSVGTVTADQSVGELAIFDSQPRSATVTATEDLDVLEFSGSNLVDAIRTEPQLGINLLGTAAERLRATNLLVG